jgi:hypothetical protein
MYFPRTRFIAKPSIPPINRLVMIAAIKTADEFDVLAFWGISNYIPP